MEGRSMNTERRKARECWRPSLAYITNAWLNKLVAILLVYAVIVGIVSIV
jgi:hypothetical protein